MKLKASSNNNNDDDDVGGDEESAHSQHPDTIEKSPPGRMWSTS